MRPISYYSIDNHFRPEFEAGQTVLDIGSGRGRHLRHLRDHGIRGIGVDLDMDALQSCRRDGFLVTAGAAEVLPVADQSCDAVICFVTLPYTDEAAAVREWARVLKPGGRAITCLHGLGYVLRQVLQGPSMTTRIYGLRTLINSWCYRAFGRKTVSDTLYQSRARMATYYERSGLRLVNEVLSPRFMGGHVFVLHHLEKKAG